MSALTVSMHAEAALARLLGAKERMWAGLRAVMRRLAIKGQAKVKGEKLSGQLLHVRTGTLRRSINEKIEETSTGIYGKVGTNVVYARPLEEGFDGAVNVRAHVRRLVTGATQSVREHVRHMHVIGRRFLRSTLEEMKPEIQTSIRAELLKAVQA